MDPDNGTDSERLRCYGVFHKLLGLDWTPIPEGPSGQVSAILTTTIN